MIEVLGVRHHGPGSARAVVTALDALRPDTVLIEGPADADPLTVFSTAPDLRPPVALLAYAVDEPKVSAFWPMAVFSPEWQALRWAGAHGATVRFCDLPSSLVLAERDEQPASRVSYDPISVLAEAGGYDDPERWWDDVIEARTDGTPFAALTEAMAELRAGRPLEEREAQREAYMRSVMRDVAKTAERVAVVCGAWHAPALAGTLPLATADAKLLRGLAKRKTSLTWVPWTHSRLSYASGYGAGVQSPGWYHHLFTAPDRPVTRWLTKVAGALREHDLPVSSAHVIEAVRLAETLAVLRNRPLAGLDEVTEATRSILCDGDEISLRFVTRDVVVGEALGEVPADAPAVPLMADLAATARRLRLKLDPLGRPLTLDLRQPNDLHKSQLLHRLAALDVPWGVPDAAGSRSTGTFRESWSLRWDPALSVNVIEAALWGTTIPTAATARLADRAARATDLATVTDAVEAALLADLPDALAPILHALDAKAAADLDVEHLMRAWPALVRAMRYGDVRGTDTSALTEVVDALLARICAALPAASGGLGDEAAASLRACVDEVHAAVLLRGEDAGRALWLATLHGLADRRDVAPVLAGRIVRLLLDTDAVDAAEVARRLSAALSIGPSAPAKAGWAQGLLDGGALLLVHHRSLLGVLDGWVAALGEQEFIDVLPLLRRTFGTFTAPERRTIGEQVRSLGAPTSTVDEADDYDVARAAPAVRTVAELLGLT